MICRDGGISADFRKSLNSLLNCEEKLDVLKTRQETLNKDELPAGMKPYVSPWTMPSLDEVSSLARSSINIPVPANMTLGELRELLYLK